MFICEDCGFELFEEEVVCPKCQAVQPKLLAKSSVSPDQQISEYKKKAGSALRASRDMLLAILVISGILMSIELAYNSQVISHFAQRYRGKGSIFLPLSMLMLLGYFLIVGLPGVPVTRVKTAWGKGLFRFIGTSKLSEAAYYVLMSILLVVLGIVYVEPSYQKTLTEKWSDMYDVALIGKCVRTHMSIYYFQMAVMFAYYNVCNILGIYQYDTELDARIGRKFVLFNENEYY
ncbi:MAG: hypothetical protein LBT59_00435 [Clostridiales bacterium]|jgi:hypothetical protein|nr:hypothetical protein [Clostridiales bacterium]